MPTPEEWQSIRKAKGLTQRQMAILAGYTQPARWSDIETGKKRLPESRSNLLLIKLGLHPGYMDRR